MSDFELELLDVLNTNEGLVFMLKTSDGLIIKPKLMRFKSKAFINLVTEDKRVLNVGEIISQVTRILNHLKGVQVSELVFNYSQATDEVNDARRLLEPAFKVLNVSFINEKEHIFFYGVHDV